MPINLAALVLCDTIDELYHNEIDGMVISALRFGVFFGIVTDAYKKTVQNIKAEEAHKID